MGLVWSLTILMHLYLHEYTARLVAKNEFKKLSGLLVAKNEFKKLRSLRDLIMWSVNH